MNSDEIYIEFTKHLEIIANRLNKIEEKMDAQHERDHKHELKLQELENKFNALEEKINKSLSSVQESITGLKKDVDNLTEKIRSLENNSTQKKARIVDRIADRAFEILIAASIGGAIAWLIARLK
jgi:chromosome segregation ATPase